MGYFLELAACKTLAPSIDGFCVVARRDRTDEGGGGVIIYVRDAFVARRIDGPPGDTSETVVVAVGEGDRAPRFFEGYRAPRADMAPFCRALAFHAAEAASLGAAFIGGGDMNLPELQLRQSGADRRVVRSASETPACREFTAALEEARLRW